MPTATAQRATKPPAGKPPASPAPRVTPEEARAAQMERWERDNQAKADRAAVSLKSLAEAGKLFEGNRPNPLAQKFFADPDRAREFLKQCQEDEDLRRAVVEQGLDLDDLAEWIRTSGAIGRADDKS